MKVKQVINCYYKKTCSHGQCDPNLRLHHVCCLNIFIFACYFSGTALFINLYMHEQHILQNAKGATTPTKWFWFSNPKDNVHVEEIFSITTNMTQFYLTKLKRQKIIQVYIPLLIFLNSFSLKWEGAVTPSKRCAKKSYQLRNNYWEDIIKRIFKMVFIIHIQSTSYTTGLSK